MCTEGYDLCKKWTLYVLEKAPKLNFQWKM